MSCSNLTIVCKFRKFSIFVTAIMVILVRTHGFAGIREIIKIVRTFQQKAQKKCLKWFFSFWQKKVAITRKLEREKSVYMFDLMLVNCYNYLMAFQFYCFTKKIHFRAQNRNVEEKYIVQNNFPSVFHDENNQVKLSHYKTCSINYESFD